MKPSEQGRPIQILQWSAWAPAVSTHQDWKNFFQGKCTIDMKQAPDVSAIPAMLRRRMSLLSRMATATAFNCCRLANVSPALVRTVFASRHGEMGVTAELLGQLHAKELLSPMAFSGSVHHTAMGYFSIAAENRQAMRAVAGGEASFCYGFLDAAGMLSDRDDSPVLLIAADDKLPEPFKKIGGPMPFPWAVAFLLGHGRPARMGGLSLAMTDAVPPIKTSRALNNPALEFLRWFLGPEKVFVQTLAQRSWRWQK